MSLGFCECGWRDLSTLPWVKVMSLERFGEKNRVFVKLGNIKKPHEIRLGVRTYGKDADR